MGLSASTQPNQNSIRSIKNPSKHQILEPNKIKIKNPDNIYHQHQTKPGIIQVEGGALGLGVDHTRNNNQTPKPGYQTKFSTCFNKNPLKKIMYPRIWITHRDPRVETRGHSPSKRLQECISSKTQQENDEKVML